MKRIVSLLLLCFVLLGFGSCASDTENWQTVVLDCGTIKIPKEWTVEFEDEILYIYDELLTPVMIELSPPDKHGLRSNKYYKDYTWGEWLTSACYSNSAIYGYNLISYNGITCEKMYLHLECLEAKTLFVVWDSSFTEDMLKKIAKTYINLS